MHLDGWPTCMGLQRRVLLNPIALEYASTSLGAPKLLAHPGEKRDIGSASTLLRFLPVFSHSEQKYGGTHRNAEKAHLLTKNLCLSRNVYGLPF